MSNIDQLIEALDENPLSNSVRVALSKALFQKLGALDPAETLVMLSTGSPSDDETREAVRELWRRVFTYKRDASNSRARLAVCAVPSDELLDGYLAEYIVQWAKDAGLADEQIEKTFIEVTAATP